MTDRFPAANRAGVLRRLIRSHPHLAVAMIALVGYFLWTSVLLATQGEITMGRVVGLDESSSDSGTGYSPIFVFTAAGNEYEVNSGIASDPPDYAVGDIVRVRYLPANPQIAEIDSPWISPWLYGGVVALMTLALAAMNVVGMRRIARGESFGE